MWTPCSQGAGPTFDGIFPAACRIEATSAGPLFARFSNAPSRFLAGFAAQGSLALSYASQLLSTLQQRRGKVNQKIT
jgi:hypothetical protein